MAFSGKQAAEKWSDIIKEISFLRNVRHRNIVGYRACYLKEQTCWVFFRLFCHSKFRSKFFFIEIKVSIRNIASYFFKFKIFS